MNSSLRVLANCIDLINLHLQTNVGGAHCASFSVLHKQNYVPMAIFHKQRDSNFCEKPPLRKKSVFSIINM